MLIWKRSYFCEGCNHWKLAGVVSRRRFLSCRQRLKLSSFLGHPRPSSSSSSSLLWPSVGPVVSPLLLLSHPISEKDLHDFLPKDGAIIFSLHRATCPEMDAIGRKTFFTWSETPGLGELVVVVFETSFWGLLRTFRVTFFVNNNFWHYDKMQLWFVVVTLDAFSSLQVLKRLLPLLVLSLFPAWVSSFSTGFLSEIFWSIWPTLSSVPIE